MSSVLHFRCSTPCFPQEDAVLVVFAAPTQFNRNAVTDAIAKETRQALAPDAVYLLYPIDMVGHAAKDLAANRPVFAVLPDAATIGIYSYDTRGEIALHATLGGSPPEKFPAEQVRRQGLTTLMRRHAGVLDASLTAHFVRPSKRPSTRFLHASHALSDGAEIFFAALWLLPHLSDDIEVVHIDTSAIASVVLSAFLLRKAAKHPTVLNFHSYEGMQNHPFSRDRADLVLISASQSGAMATDVIGKVRDPAKVLTLYSSADAPARSQIICDIRYSPHDNPQGYQSARPIGSTPHTRPIRLISEHFTVEPEAPRSVLPTIKDPPDVVKATLTQLVGKNVLRSLRSTGVGTDRISVWIDMQKLEQLEIFKKWVRDLVAASIPASTRAIVHLDNDADSLLLGDAIVAEVGRQGGILSNLKRISLEDLETEKADWAAVDAPVVITGAPAGRGTRLLTASRALRRYAPNSHRIFISPGMTAMSHRGISILRRNLVQPNYSFHAMFALVLDRSTLSESWRDERILLLELEEADPVAVGPRLDEISGQPEGRTDGLFLQTGSLPLSLRENFAFWPGVECRLASQADVFTTVSAIMENLRSDEVEISQRLVNDAQTHTVLEAETFSRYNDGVIQASFLRSALPIELDYRDSPMNSRLLRELLAEMVDYRSRQQGEALGEFLLALACKRLKLTSPDWARLKEKFASTLTLETGIIGALGRYLVRQPN